MRHLIALLALALIVALPATAFAENGQLKAQEALEEMMRAHEEAINAARDSEPVRVQVPTTTDKTFHELRSEVQSLTAACARLERDNARLSEETSRIVAARRDENAAAAERIAFLEGEIVVLQAEVDDARPTFWDDPADWAAIAGGLAAGALLGVGLARRSRSRKHAWPTQVVPRSEPAPDKG